MYPTVYYIAWCAMYVLCAALGFWEEPEGLVRVALTALGVLFFVPPFALLYGAQRADDRRTARFVRKIATASLLATVIALLANILSAFGSETLGTFLHIVLGLVSSPMLCCGYWVLSLFLWACVLLWALRLTKPPRKNRIPPLY